MRFRNYSLAGLGFGALLFAGQALGAGVSNHVVQDSSTTNAIAPTARVYSLDDGDALLAQAEIDIDQAVAAAQSAATGKVGEIDLEMVNGVLVFNVDIGDADVKVDASTGDVISSDHDD